MQYDNFLLRFYRTSTSPSRYQAQVLVPDSADGGRFDLPLTDAELIDNSHVDRTRVGVYLGAGEGIQDFDNMIYQIARNYRPEARAVYLEIPARQNRRRWQE